MQTRIDPTRTLGIVRRIDNKILPLFKRLKRRIRKYKFKTSIENSVTNTQSAELKRFERWMKKQVSQIDKGADIWETYIRETYEKAHGRIHTDTKFPPIKDRKEFIRLVLNKPETKRKIKMLANVVFSDLKGVTQTMGTQMQRVLVDGFIRGENPNKIAKALNERVDKIGITRARTIARTEIIRVHAEGQLDALEAFGQEDVSFQAEYSTAGDDRVCPLCIPLEGTIMSIKKARGLIPVHPNCRCAFLPVAPKIGRKKRSSKRSGGRSGSRRRATQAVADSARNTKASVLECKCD